MAGAFLQLLMLEDLVGILDEIRLFLGTVQQHKIKRKKGQLVTVSTFHLKSLPLPHHS
jgi:hypothetical protein